MEKFDTFEANESIHDDYIAHLEGERDNLRKYLHMATEQLKAEQDAHNALRQRLKELEWCGVPGNDICYVCCGDRKHDKDCWLGNAIKGV